MQAGLCSLSLCLCSLCLSSATISLSSYQTMRHVPLVFTLLFFPCHLSLSHNFLSLLKSSSRSFPQDKSLSATSPLFLCSFLFFACLHTLPLFLVCVSRSLLLFMLFLVSLFLLSHSSFLVLLRLTHLFLPTLHVWTIHFPLSFSNHVLLSHFNCTTFFSLLHQRGSSFFFI
ncbi:hypothetical protein RchiOBHm_Chr7g0189571 [Rosa chinensis]|uniref:Uncharacterized protein n=1 Tax=Rosa chinensis TaxID=74649 RepID=A0A2P6P4S4_ROSCH|nr:hypothetical protein RchiOBHm_Chr7g0189571 [Rosa chinensis]